MFTWKLNRVIIDNNFKIKLISSFICYIKPLFSNICSSICSFRLLFSALFSSRSTPNSLLFVSNSSALELMSWIIWLYFASNSFIILASSSSLNLIISSSSSSLSLSLSASVSLLNFVLEFYHQVFFHLVQCIILEFYLKKVFNPNRVLYWKVNKDEWETF